MSDSQEVFAYLLQSENRTALLQELSSARSLDRYELERRLDASRRTVTRVLNDLEERQYLRDGSEGYTLTALGSAVVETYRDCMDRAELAHEFRPLLAHADGDDIDCDLALFRGAELTVATDTEPYAPLDRMLDLRRSATQVRLVSPIVEKRSLEQLAGRLGTEGVEFEVVLPDGLYERAQSQPAYRESLAAATDAATVRHLVYPGPVPLLFGTLDDVAVVGATVDSQPHALVESDRPAFRTWVDDRIEEYRGASEPVGEG